MSARTPPDADLALIASIADELPVGVWVARVPGGELAYANRAFVEIMGMGAREDQSAGGYSQPYGIHTRDGGLYPEERLPFVQAVRQRATVIVDDLVIHRRDGGRVHVRATARPMFDEQRAIKYVAIAFIDISREAGAERARLESEERLARAQRMESIGTLAGGVAHDFNNLLAAMQVFVSTLRLGESDSTRLETLDQMATVVATGAELTTSLLALSRGDAPQAVPLSLDAAARKVLGFVERALPAGIEVVAELSAGSARIVGDSARLQQVLLNLMVNARDAMPAGGRLAVRTSRVTLDAAAARARPPLVAGDHVLLEVEDSGVGIPAHLRSRIFEPYFTTKTTGAQRGTGLGLATVWTIVQSHAGSIEVLDGKPSGTLLRLHFPAAAPGPDPADQLASNDQRLAPTSEAGGGTILLIEDDPHLRGAAESGLRALGHQVMAAADGVAGVELFRLHRARVNAVVLDLALPRLSGLEVLRQIRALDRSVPVIITTGAPRAEDLQPLLEAGVSRVLPKPYDLAALFLALREATSV